jgi:hypothetical protein
MALMLWLDGMMMMMMMVNKGVVLQDGNTPVFNSNCKQRVLYNLTGGSSCGSARISPSNYTAAVHLQNIQHLARSQVMTEP